MENDNFQTTIFNLFSRVFEDRPSTVKMCELAPNVRLFFDISAKMRSSKMLTEPHSFFS